MVTICLFPSILMSFFLAVLLYYSKPCLVCSSNNHGYPSLLSNLEKNVSKISPLTITFAIGFWRKNLYLVRAFLSRTDCTAIPNYLWPLSTWPISTGPLLVDKL